MVWISNQNIDTNKVGVHVCAHVHSSHCRPFCWTIWFHFDNVHITSHGIQNQNIHKNKVGEYPCSWMNTQLTPLRCKSFFFFFFALIMLARAHMAYNEELEMHKFFILYPNNGHMANDADAQGQEIFCILCPIMHPWSQWNADQVNRCSTNQIWIHFS